MPPVPPANAASPRLPAVSALAASVAGVVTCAGLMGRPGDIEGIWMEPVVGAGQAACQFKVG